MKDVVFFDIDTQYDFMRKYGRLYVPDAERIIPNLRKITQFARKKNISVIASTDKHKMTDREIASGAFAPHCLNGTNGQKKIKETSLTGAVYVPNKKLDNKKIELLKKKNRLIIEKQEYDMFSNPNVRHILRDIKTAYVYGVATDYCVKEAVLNLRKLGVKTYIVKDAIKPVFKNNEGKDLELFRRKGAELLTTRKLLKRSQLIKK